MTSVTEGIEALASTRVTVRPVGRMANEGFVIHAQARPCPLLLCLSEGLQVPQHFVTTHFWPQGMVGLAGFGGSDHLPRSTSSLLLQPSVC